MVLCDQSLKTRALVNVVVLKNAFHHLLTNRIFECEKNVSNLRTAFLLLKQQQAAVIEIIKKLKIEAPPHALHSPDFVREKIDRWLNL